MKRSNLIPITGIYDIYPKYTYSDDVKKFMDEIVYIDRANVYTKDEVIAMLEDLKQDFIAEAYGIEMDCTDYVVNVKDIDKIIQQKINALKENKCNE